MLLHRQSELRAALCVAVAVVWFARPATVGADDLKQAAVGSIKGPGGGWRAEARLRRALIKTGSIKVVRSKFFRSLAKKKGLRKRIPGDREAVSTLARELKLDAFVHGLIRRKKKNATSRRRRRDHELHLVVINGGDGKVVGEVTIPVKKRRISWAELRRAAGELIPVIAATSHVPPPPPTPRAKPKPRTKAVSDVEAKPASILDTRNVFIGLSVAAGVVLLVLLINILRRRPSKKEALAVYELSRQLQEEAVASRLKLSRVYTSGRLAAIESTAAQRMDQITNRHVAQVQQCVPQEVDGAFFGVALKAVAPKESWKDEFAQRAAEVQHNIVRPDLLQQDQQEVIEDALANLHAEVIPATVASLGEEASANLTTLSQHPERFKRFLGQEPVFQNVAGARADMHRGVAVGGSAVAVGGAVLMSDTARSLMVEFMGTDIAAQIAGAIAGELAHSQIVEKIVEYIYGWIVEEVGEQVLEEVVEALAAALTGVGIVFTVWKAIKYGALVKRLAIDKEPLVKIQGQMREDAVALVRFSGEQAKVTAGDAVRGAWHSMDHHLSRVEAGATERRAWAAGYLGGSVA